MSERFNNVESFETFLSSEKWFNEESKKARSGLAASGLNAFMEIVSAPATPLSKKHVELLNAVYESQIFTFGWPIGLVFDDEFKPFGTAEGITTEIRGIERNRNSYDYWSLRKTGDFYSLISLFEDTRDESSIFFDTRIVRTAEAILHSYNLFTKLGMSPNSEIGMHIYHRGLKGRYLRGASHRFVSIIPKTSKVDEAEGQIFSTLQSLKDDIVIHVQTLLEPLFVLFDIYSIDRSTQKEIVENFIKGRIL